MDDWMENGCRLGWLIDLINQISYMYPLNQERQEITGLGQLSGKEVLPEFSLDLANLVS